jgi:hypothetical protein
MINDINKKDNIFIHDAVPTWSGFLYQGRIAAYLAVKKINDLYKSGNECEIKNYKLEMEKCEDIAIICDDGNGRKYQSIHQVKNEKKNTVEAYKNPLTQLMLEKGFCNKNNYGMPEAYLHVSNEIKYKNKTLKVDVSSYLGKWKDDILRFYNELNQINKKFNYNKITLNDLNDLIDVLKKNKDTIGINRKEYKNKYKHLEEECQNTLKLIGSNNLISEQTLKDVLKDFIDYLKDEMFVTQVTEDVEIYEYEQNVNYCSGSDIFEIIVEQVKQYKGNNCGFSEEQFKYIADIIINFVETKILERHKLMQEKKGCIDTLKLSEFQKILDQSVENYDEEANILTLNRQYNDYLERFCNTCHREKKDVECTNCKLQQDEYRKGFLIKNEFVKFCYNLNPECDKKISNRDCLAFLLKEDGMMETVFPIIKQIEDEKIFEKEDKMHIKIRNKNKTAYVTAITNKNVNNTVENIVKAMEQNEELVKNIFEADQLITTRLQKKSDVWDSSCIKIRPEHINEGKNNDDKSIYVPKKPEFIKVDELIEDI